jgi:putative hydrolase of HD superfamily
MHHTLIPIDSLNRIGKLKTTYRYSETAPGRKESVADHSWRVALLVSLYADMLATPDEQSRALRMALVHDIAEAVTGDIDHVKISDGIVTREEKQAAEQRAFDELKKAFPKETGESLEVLWTEYDKGITDVARFVKALDKLETMTQFVANGYTTYDRPELIPNYADKAVSDFPALAPVLNEIKSRLRKEYETGGMEWKATYDI